MMNPQLQFVFLMAGAVCFFMATFFDKHPPYMSWNRYVALGLLFFTIPFAVNAALAGW